MEKLYFYQSSVNCQVPGEIMLPGKDMKTSPEANAWWQEGAHTGSFADKGLSTVITVIAKN